MNSRLLGGIVLLVVAVLAYVGDRTVGTDGPAAPNPAQHGPSAASGSRGDGGATTIAAAYRAQRSNVQVAGRGIVQRVLRDDIEGSRHQRFILRLDNRQTLLVAHNIDVAPRIDGLREGDEVSFNGEYEWNNQGGVLHWTHRDPAARHVDGWLKHDGRTYR
ncbi:MAG: DUF3465 domain-containing protein [Chromatiaceae bacterium]|nr:DUF3465 domain-containing protein [Chromatiaceae bacterium]MCP5421385.1 DUF3465 domain-containing protein [Chromatiaceae bacterium]